MPANKYSSAGTFTTAIDGTASTPTLKNLADSGRKIGNEIDNATTKATLSNWELKCKFGSSPTANRPVELYFIKAIDDTNYEYGDDSSDPPASALAGVFPVQSTTNAQRIALENVTLPNCRFKPYIYNRSGQAFTNVDSDNILSYRTFNIESV